MADRRAFNTASVSGLLALASFQFTRATDANLARLHEPGSENAGYAQLGNSHLVRSAFGIWAKGSVFLNSFKPRSARWLIGFHVMANSVFVIAAIITVAALIDLPPASGASNITKLT